MSGKINTVAWKIAVLCSLVKKKKVFFFFDGALGKNKTMPPHIYSANVWTFQGTKHFVIATVFPELGPTEKKFYCPKREGADSCLLFYHFRGLKTFPFHRNDLSFLGIGDGISF